CMQGVQLPFTF
nr:immunoglobulin light chain junction region [Macaca mulatta]